MRPSRCLQALLPLLLAARLLASEPDPRPDAGSPATPLEPIPADATGTSVEQLLKSAERLEAAGSKEEAERLRQEARKQAVRENTIARKESELECLVEEIERLRKLTGQSRSVMIRVVALEFSRAALGEQAREFDEVLGLSSHDHKGGSEVNAGAGAPQNAASGRVEKPIRPAGFSANHAMAYGLVDEHPLSNTLVQQLLEKKLITVLAEPTLVTDSGNSAAFLSGGQAPVKIQTLGGGADPRLIPFGVRLEAKPTVLADRRIRVQTKFCFSEPDFSRAVEVRGEQIPALLTRGVNTQVELRSGQTAVLGGLVSRVNSSPAAPAAAVKQAQQSSQAEDPGAKSAETAAAEPAATRELVVLITAELMNSRRAIPALQPIPAQDDHDAEETKAEETKSGAASSFVPDDLRYFPASPVPRKGTLR